ncbi:periplasmic chaperone for outer membrane proteins SurA [Ekhidna lutea]|uniref:Periplasmic chaperone for outer membrane proteins SurA n=1 Tax=Ekhidna lutea TaxID=447679 RepID=A0A239FK30_EKHLU|nr:peptidylprolyl isomerase [Ekhidna lutea]SNS56653.1 periplasmic chaperone for outer membrane proteins SurA [Ekhidna lutea]
MKKQNRQMRLRFTIISAAIFFSISSIAQSNDVVIDKIIAKVDDYIILKSELERSYLDFLSRGQMRGSNAKCDILQQLVVNKMLMAQSEIDSIFVDDAEVNNNLDRRMSMMAQQFGGEEAIIKAYGKSIEQIRAEIFDNIKEQLTIQRMQSTLTSELKVTPAEVKKFFKNIPQDSLPYFSTEVSIAQIMIDAEPGKEQKDKVRNLLLDIKDQIESGISFEVLAKKYSQDPGSAANGGQLGFYGRGELAPEYEATALSLKPGEISMPVETQFGFHLIQLQEKRGNTYKTRHILITPQPNQADYARAEQYLDSLRTMIQLDSITFQAAAKEYSDDQLTSSAGGFFQDETGALRVSAEELDPNIFFTIDTMKIGTITKPLRFQKEDGSYAYRILYFKNKIPPHQANLDDDYQKIAAAALTQKKNRKISQWFDKARGNVFIEIDPEYNYCNLTN